MRSRNPHLQRPKVLVDGLDVRRYRRAGIRPLRVRQLRHALRLPPLPRLLRLGPRPRLRRPRRRATAVRVWHVDRELGQGLALPEQPLGGRLRRRGGALLSPHRLRSGAAAGGGGAWVLAGSLEGFSGGDQARLGEFESRARVMAGVYRPKKSRAGLPFTVFRVPFSLTCGSRLKELWRGQALEFSRWRSCRRTRPDGHLVYTVHSLLAPYRCAWMRLDITSTVLGTYCS
jgi:hypothetical protein